MSESDVRPVISSLVANNTRVEFEMGLLQERTQPVLGDMNSAACPALEIV